MRKAYLLAHDDGLGTRNQVKQYLSAISEIIHWRYDMPHSFYVISELDAQQLAIRLRQVSGRRGKFIFVQITADKQGWITNDSWYLINQKHHKPKNQPRG